LNNVDNTDSKVEKEDEDQLQSVHYIHGKPACDIDDLIIIDKEHSSDNPVSVASQLKHH
jgi:hypothetical protein